MLVNWRELLVSLDEAGLPVDRAKVIEDNQKAKASKFGALDPTLAEKVDKMRPDETLSVSIWVNGFDHLPFEPDNSPSVDGRGKNFAPWLAERKQKIESHLAPVLNRLRAAGVEMTPSPTAPLLSGSIKKAQAIALRSFPGIEVFEDLPLEVHAATQNLTVKNANPGVASDPYWVSPSYYMSWGSNSNIALVDYGTIDFDKYRSYFGYDTYNRQTLQPTCTPFTFLGNEFHQTAVASVASGTSAGVGWPIQGVSPRNGIYMAHFCAEKRAAGVIAFNDDALAWAVNSPVAVVNMSFGSSTSGAMGVNERLADYYSYGWRKTFVASAGNITNPDKPEQQYVNDPAIGYNVIAVGDLDDKQTSSATGHALWADDSMSPASSWKNPTSVHSDREKPDLAAPGTNIAVWKGGSYSNSDVILQSGTSFSAPVVTGIISEIVAENVSIYARPEEIRAILLASAWQQVEAPGGDRKSGAGVVNGARAIAVTRRLAGNSDVADPTMNLRPQVEGVPCGAIKLSYTPNYAYWGTSANCQVITAKAGDRIRASLAWTSNTTSANYLNEAHADIDLFLVNSSGQTVAYSYSYDNTSETIQFTVPVDGSYTVQVKPWRIDFTGVPDGVFVYSTAVDVLPASAL